MKKYLSKKISIKYLFAFASILLLNCKKEDGIGLEIDGNVTTKDKVIVITDSLIELPITKQYLLNSSENSSTNYAYPELISLNDTAMMFIAKSSSANIEDFASASLLKLQSSNNGRTWRRGVSQSADFEGAINSSSPSITRISDTKLLLVYLVKYSMRRIDLVIEDSEDNGETWSQPRILFSSNVGYQIINNARIINVGNRIILPVSIPESGNMNTYTPGGSSVMVVFYYFSDDGGITWHRSVALKNNKYNLLEPGITHIKDNELLMNIRTDNGKVLFARSYDFGNKWQFVESLIDSPSSPQTIKKIPGTDMLLMVWNNSTKDVSIHGGNRSPLSLALSKDGGRNWVRIFDIEPFNNYVRDHAYVAVEFDKGFAYFSYNERSNSSYAFAVKLARIPLNALKSIKL